MCDISIMSKQLQNIPMPHVTVDVTSSELQFDVTNIVTESSARSNFSLQLSNAANSTTGNVLVQAPATSATISVATDIQYEQFLADIWVGVLLTLMVLSCVCCMCSCLLYHKFQQWKQAVIESRNGSNIESGQYEVDILPSYTIASGLPNYEEALTQLKTVKEFCKIHNHSNNLENRRKSLLAQLQVPQEMIDWLPNTSNTPRSNLNIVEMFQVYRRNSLNITK